MTRYLPLTDQDPPRLGPYRLVGRIGRGGQATVYYGVDTTGRDAEAAVKVLHVDWGDHQERRHVLERELRNDHLTPAVDLFAWGATMIYAATGRHAFPGDTAQAVMFRVVDSPPQLYDIEEPVRALVARCLAKDPRRRPTAAQAKRLLVGQAPRPRKFTPGVASSGPAGAAKAPAPTKVGPVLAGPGTAGVAAPVVLAPADSPRPWPRWLVVIASVVALALAGVVWAASRSNGEASSRSPAAAATTPTVVAAYDRFNADWPPRCPPADNLSGSQIRKTYCSGELIDNDPRRRIERYCAEFQTQTSMQKEGRPQTGGHGIAAVRYTTRWSRSDDGRTGTFVSYTLKLNSAAAIWWESGTDKVACFVFGPAGSDADLLRMYLEHHFVVA